ncbi:hypothetical protein [Microbacterium sp. P5_E9]
MSTQGRPPRFWPWVVAAIGVIAGVFGIVTFLTGNNLPDFFNQSNSGNAGTETTNQPTYEKIIFPATVFDFARMDNPTRQSYLLTASEAGATAYAYSYWQDPASVWMDATAAAGGNTATVVGHMVSEADAAGQRTDSDGPTTCVWDQDSDPNTPMHSVKCFRIDNSTNRALIIWTEAQSVGDPNARRLTEELWNQTTWE